MTDGTGNLGTSGINDRDRLRSGKLEARPPENDLPPCLFACLDLVRRSSEERFCRSFESLWSNEEDESPALFMVVMIVSKAK
jgi:hypothetical protein